MKIKLLVGILVATLELFFVGNLVAAQTVTQGGLSGTLETFVVTVPAATDTSTTTAIVYTVPPENCSR